ncbi:MAG: hypothetical protein R3B47_01445 [Bacteroidia bacterium]
MDHPTLPLNITCVTGVSVQQIHPHQRNAARIISQHLYRSKKKLMTKVWTGWIW